MSADPAINLRRPRERVLGGMILRIKSHNDIALSFLCDVEVDIIGGSHIIAFDARRWTSTLNIGCDMVFASSNGAGTPMTMDSV